MPSRAMHATSPPYRATAPGSAIISTSTGWNIYDGLGFSNEETSSMEGTSMAAPHVTGAAALYLQHNPGATPDQVKQAIMSSSVPAGIGSALERSILVIDEGLVPHASVMPNDPSAPSSSPTNGTFLVPPPSEVQDSDPEGDYACEVTQWTSWTDCSARDPCSRGLRSRYRFPENDIPLDLILVECPLLTTVETCVAPGECEEVGQPDIFSSIEILLGDVIEIVSSFS